MIILRFDKSKNVHIQEKAIYKYPYSKEGVNNFLVLVKCLRVTSSCRISQMIQFQELQAVWKAQQCGKSV